MFKIVFLLFITFCSSAFALKIDSLTSNFCEREKKRVEQYDFEGEYPELKNIDIDARKKLHVELLLNGSYPLLEKIHFEGGFGTITGNLTGSFPKLKEISIACTKAILDLNLEGKWEKDCLISITCKGATTIHLPKDIECHVTIVSSPFTKINNQYPKLEKRKTKIGKSLQRIYSTFKNPQQKTLKILISADREEINLI